MSEWQEANKKGLSSEDGSIAMERLKIIESDFFNGS